MATKFITKGRGKMRKIIPLTENYRNVICKYPTDILESIERVHQNNWRLIRLHKLKVGLVLEHRLNKHQIKIVSIHPIYGWVVCDYCDYDNIGWEMLKQDMSNISDFIIKSKGQCK